MVNFKQVVLSAALAAIAVSAPSYASNAINIKNRIVRYSDLDLSTQNGQQRLAVRIKKAIEGVCSGPIAYTAKEKLDLARCQEIAIANAQFKANQAIARYQDAKQLAVNGNTAIIGN